jgi:hypothetical protein
MAYNVPIKPQGLGLIAPTGTGPTNAVQATANLNVGLSDPNLASGNSASGNDLVVNKIEFKANAGNSGRVFLCSNAAKVAGTLNLATFVGVIRTLDPGTSWSITNPVGMSTYRPGDYCLAIETAGDTAEGNCDTT